ncbi:calcium-binding protein [Desulfoluna butyratoxydans]|uniref:Uncharacterized protein n=1 Tax=Desulfoluna butyratoxydans TaxID=231438 RepID=A0A4U8YTN6_9BACT|nr:calcium-binding protein [Desulfoluna butyratoxydans]VFQ47224.1 uncharacterised protein family calcium binding protein ccbp [Desulfoluna butyratoxydans]
METELDERAWDRWLKERLTFPFQVKRVQDDNDNPFRPSPEEKPFGLGHVMKVVDVEEDDDFYGVILKVREGRRVGYVPLLDVEIVEADGQNAGPIQTYLDWEGEVNG